MWPYTDHFTSGKLSHPSCLSTKPTLGQSYRLTIVETICCCCLASKDASDLLGGLLCSQKLPDTLYSPTRDLSSISFILIWFLQLIVCCYITDVPDKK